MCDMYFNLFLFVIWVYTSYANDGVKELLKLKLFQYGSGIGLGARAPERSAHVSRDGSSESISWVSHAMSLI